MKFARELWQESAAVPEHLSGRSKLSTPINSVFRSHRSILKDQMLGFAL